MHKFIPAWGVSDISPFCVKLEAYLRMANLPFETVIGDTQKAPKKKLPCIEHDGQMIGDSDLIIAYLKEAVGDQLDADLTPKERSLSVAFQSMIDEHFYFVLIYWRWQVEGNWQLYEPTIRAWLEATGVPDHASAALASSVHENVVETLRLQGVGRHSPEEVTTFGIRQLDAISEFLGEKAYCSGDSPRSIDATVYASLVSLLRPPFESSVKDHALGRPNLIAYCGRITDRYFS